MSSVQIQSPITVLEPLTINQSLNNKQVNIYLRVNSKNAKIITISPHISYQQLINIVQTNFKIQQNNIILFHKGQQIANSKQYIFQNKNIIHILNERHIKKQNIHIFIKLLDGSRKQKFQVNTNLVIRDFVQNKFASLFGNSSDEVSLIYVGKQLNLEKTFVQQLVENESQIICVINKSKKNEKLSRVSQSIDANNCQKMVNLKQEMNKNDIEQVQVGKECELQRLQNENIQKVVENINKQNINNLNNQIVQQNNQISVQLFNQSHQLIQQNDSYQQPQIIATQQSPQLGQMNNQSQPISIQKRNQQQIIQYESVPIKKQKKYPSFFSHISAIIQSASFNKKVY